VAVDGVALAKKKIFEWQWRGRHTVSSARFLLYVLNNNVPEARKAL
jgi:hypothetical protein